MPLRHNALLPPVPVHGDVGRQVHADEGRRLRAAPAGRHHGIPLRGGDVQLLDNGQWR